MGTRGSVCRGISTFPSNGNLVGLRDFHDGGSHRRKIELLVLFLKIKCHTANIANLCDMKKVMGARHSRLLWLKIFSKKAANISLVSTFFVSLIINCFVYETRRSKIHLCKLIELLDSVILNEEEFARDNAKALPMIVYSRIDLGIVTYHFELGAGKAN